MAEGVPIDVLGDAGLACDRLDVPLHEVVWQSIAQSSVLVDQSKHTPHKGRCNGLFKRKSPLHC
jgi:hypothetical protein